MQRLSETNQNTLYPSTTYQCPPLSGAMRRIRPAFFISSKILRIPASLMCNSSISSDHPHFTRERSMSCGSSGCCGMRRNAQFQTPATLASNGHTKRATPFW